MAASPALASGTVLLPQHLIDLDRHELRTRDGRDVELRPQALDLLVHLARRAGQVAAKAELLDEVWPGLIVTDDSLVQAIGDIRRAIGDDAHKVIQTVPRRGYRLIASEPQTPAFAPQPALAAPDNAPLVPSPLPPAAEGWRRWAVAGALAASVAGTLAAWQPWRSPGGVAAPAPDRPPIAVLDFGGGLSGEDEPLARGFAEDLVNELSRNADLRVIAAHSAFTAASGARSWPDAARRLGARYVVDGRVRRAGETLRLTVELLDSSDARVVWSERQEVGAAQVLAARDAIVQRIAGSLHSTMRRNEEARALHSAPASLDIYEMTLRALSLKHRFTPHDSREAKALLERVVALDPRYAPGWTYLGVVNSADALLQLNGPFSVRRMNEAIEQMERGIALNGDLPAAYLGLAFSYPAVGRHADGVRAGRRCLELAPSDAECMMFLAVALTWAGQPREALALARRALERNPLPPSYVLYYHGLVLWANGDLDGALASLDEGRLLAPGHINLRAQRLVALVEAGRIDEAKSDLAEVQRLLGGAEATVQFIVRRYSPSHAGPLIERSLAAARALGLPAPTVAEQPAPTALR